MKRFSTAAALALSLTACLPASNGEGERDTIAVTTGRSVPVDVNGFGVDLYHQLRSGAGDGNLVVSPLSVALALGMVLPGTDSEASGELLQALRADDVDSAGRGLGALQQVLAARDKGDGITLAIANRGFVQEDFILHPEYVNELADGYDSALEAVNYKQPETARAIINRWVAQRTNDLIAELLPPGSIDSTARLTLVNAIYLLAHWQHPFDEAETSDQPFSFADGSEEDIPTMSAALTLPVTTGNDYRAVELPYQGGELAMLIIVPDDLYAFEETLDGGRLGAITADLQPRRIQLWLPKAEIRFSDSLATALKSLGVERIFCPSCDPLPGIAPESGLVVSDVVHETYLRMDEQGTEAAAATGAVIALTSVPLPPPDLRVDRPYFIALRDRASGAILFLGRIMDPR